MTIQKTFEEIDGADYLGKYPLYLDETGAEIILSCLNEEKEKREKAGQWTEEYENPGFEACLFLEDVIEKTAALLDVIKADTHAQKCIFDYVHLYGEKDERLPF